MEAGFVVEMSLSSSVDSVADVRVRISAEVGLKAAHTDHGPLSIVKCRKRPSRRSLFNDMSTFTV